MRKLFIVLINNIDATYMYTKKDLAGHMRPSLPIVVTALLTFLVLSSAVGSATDSLSIKIKSPSTAKAGRAIRFDIVVETGGKIVQKAVLKITGPAGFSIVCRLVLFDRGTAWCRIKAGKDFSWVMVRTDCVYDEYGYGCVIKYVFDVHWKTPKAPGKYTIKLSVLADGVWKYKSKEIRLLR